MGFVIVEEHLRTLDGVCRHLGIVASLHSDTNMTCFGAVRPNNLKAWRPEIDLASIFVDAESPTAEASGGIVEAQPLADAEAGVHVDVVGILP